MTKNIQIKVSRINASAVPKIKTKPLHIICSKAKINNIYSQINNSYWEYRFHCDPDTHKSIKINNIYQQYRFHCDPDTDKRIEKIIPIIIDNINQCANIKEILNKLKVDWINVGRRLKKQKSEQNSFVETLISLFSEELWEQEQRLKGACGDMKDPFKNEVTLKELNHQKTVNSIWADKASPISLLEESGGCPEELNLYQRREKIKTSASWQERTARTVGGKYYNNGFI